MFGQVSRRPTMLRVFVDPTRLKELASSTFVVGTILFIVLVVDIIVFVPIFDTIFLVLLDENSS